MIIHDEYVSAPFVETRRRLEYMDTLLIVSRRAGDLHMYSASTLSAVLNSHDDIVENVLARCKETVDRTLLPRAFGDVPPHPRLTWEI